MKRNKEMNLSWQDCVLPEGALDALESHTPPSLVGMAEKSTADLKQMAETAIASVRSAAFYGTNASKNQDLFGALLDIIENRSLTAVFQPIVDMQAGSIVGYEGLIRGPADSPLHSPLKLFDVACEHNLGVQVEHLCRRVVLEQFVALDLPGNLFLNISPKSLVARAAKHGETLAYIQKIGFCPERVIIELTESDPTYDYDVLRKAALHYRNMGFKIAIDDLGQGFSSLRLWSELRPEYVKIDMHFVQSVDSDPIKRQFVQSIQAIARESDTQVIAEGIETLAEYAAISDLGIPFGQGYHIARPQAVPPKEIAGLGVAGSCRSLCVNDRLVVNACVCTQTAERLLKAVPVVSPGMTNNQVFDVFAAHPSVGIIPVVDDDRQAVGLINRSRMVECFAQPYQRELFGRRLCRHFMDEPLIVDKYTTLQDLGHLMAKSEAHHLANGFIITDKGCYLGMGTGHDLMRELTQMQISAARYANPLTQLPGNVPINEQIDRILGHQIPFHVCYCDLDHFKPFNDAFGYNKGDDVIRLAASVLSSECDPERDFIGHIGGDDFMILFCSEDWEQRCNRMINRFGQAVQEHFSSEVREHGGYFSEDRQGKKIFQSLVSLSLGVTRVVPGKFSSHHQIAEAATEAKKQAKKIHGNSLFVERRGLK